MTTPKLQVSTWDYFLGITGYIRTDIIHGDTYCSIGQKIDRRGVIHPPRKVVIP